MEETRKQLAALMQQYSKTQKQISKETDLSTATISQFLDGSYKGDNEKIKSILDKYIEMTKDRGNNSPGVTFYKDLYNTKETLFICRYAHLNNDIALICGEAGAGKTTALNYYKDNNIGGVMVTADPCCSSSLGILKRVTKTLNRATKSDKSVMMDDLIEHLKGSNKLLIIDEADHLTLSALQTIRTLNDKAGIGVVLSGNDKIYKQMYSGQKSYEFDQIKTRAIARRRVMNSYTVDEISKIFNTTEKNLIAILFNIAEQECLRTAIKLYKIASSQNTILSEKNIQQVRLELLGY